MQTGRDGCGMEKKCMKNNALIVFLRIPELGKVKTRLAQKIGDENALVIYRALTDRTLSICQKTEANILLFWTPEIPTTINDLNAKRFLQNGKDLGERMKNAFNTAFTLGNRKVIIIGSDCYTLRTGIIDQAFTSLDENSYCIGPSIDGGYYLLGMKILNEDLFDNMTWSNEKVFENTISRMSGKVKVLEKLNDIDTYEDLVEEPELLSLVKY